MRQGDKFASDGKQVTQEDVAHLKQVYKETFIIPDERLENNREQW